MGKVILIAEDYDDSRDYMVFLLKSYGFEVYEAKNGLEAIEIAKEYHPDLILMDIGMPIMDGLTATRIIRNSKEPIATTPIIALTAFDDSFKEKAKKAGCNYFMTKPIDFDVLEPIIERYLTHSQR